jgi:hypothetical protein
MSIISTNKQIIPGNPQGPGRPAPKTARQLYRRGFRLVSKPVGKQPFLHAEPHHEMRRQAWPLDDQQLYELRALLQQDQAAAIQSDLYDQAFQAGQVTVANLYASWEKVVEPTEQEAEIMLELGFRHGHDWKTWIVSTPEKNTWTVGTSFKRPFRFMEHLRGEWFHGVVQHKTGYGETDWIVVDLDRHSGIIPTVLFIQRLRELRQLLDEEERAVMLQVNPKNGSLHLWIPVRSMTYREARSVISSWRRKLPWLEGVEIFPDNLHQVLLPLRPDKALVCDRLVPKVKRIGYRYNKLTKKKRRKTVSTYSCGYVWKWLQNPQTAPWETWETVAADACANQPDVEAQDTGVAEGPKEKRKARKLKKWTRTGMGSLGPLKGRWLKTLVDTYVNGVRPPDNTIGIIEQGVIRYCMVGKGLTAEKPRAVIKSLRQRLPDKSFSDRLLYDEAELDRANEYLLNNPLAYLPDPERSRAIWRKVDAYCTKIGFDISAPDTWKLPKATQPRLELAKSATVLALAAMVALHMRCSLEGAKCLLERVAHHVLHKNELAYSLMRKFLEEHGIPGTNSRASKVFALFRASGFLILRHKYYHDPVTGYRHGNFFVLSPLVTKDKEEEREKEVSTISLPPSFRCQEDDDLELLSVRCLWCDLRFGQRIGQLFQQKRAA